MYISSGIPVLEDSGSNMGLGINKRRASDAVETSASTSVETLNLPNSEYLGEQQKELITLFLKHSRKIECQHCRSLGKINITRIDDIEIEDTHVTEIIFACRACSKKNIESIVQAIVLGKSKIKKRQVTEDEEMVEEESNKNVTVEEQYEINRHQLQCKECGSHGTINKNGHNQSKPPQRQFKCKKCNKSVTSSEMKILLKYFITKIEMKEQDEENNNVVHDDYADNDFADTDDENIMEYNMETDDEVELVMDVRSEILMLKKRLNITEKETKKYNELMKECINLKKENIQLKKTIKELKKEKEEQKNNDNNNIKETENNNNKSKKIVKKEKKEKLIT
ncbi:hypothetical protein HPULCUR_012197 [Helicostylum pulchrum]|uniref:Uncharacterized protein n=1 Tax=Helicostylum pulchrum TaxID=562976 RepID=A0ABP9YIG1_9FUNG